jgi:hypothetical protein
VKFIIWKQALTLVELVISITISSMVMLIVMIFVADSIETVIWSNKKTEVFDDVFTFKDNFWRFSRWGYLRQNILVSNESGTWSDVILLKNIDTAEWVIFWIVDTKTLKLSPNIDYKIYWSKMLGYRKLSTSEVTAVEDTPSDVYNLSFFRDKLYQGLIIKDFQIDTYNSDEILDINIEILLYYNETNDGILLSWVNPSDLININLTF